MKKTFDRTLNSPRCLICSKGASMRLNRPHSLKRTKRLLKANIQSYMGLPVCTRCLRTLKEKQPAVATA